MAVSGDIVEQYSYGPFGQSHDISAIGNPLRYTARHWDEDAQLYYYRARYYHPELGRFIQPDPLGYADGVNIYAYVGNDPINYTDPQGLYAQGALDAFGGAADEFSLGLTSDFTEYLGVNKSSTAYTVGGVAAMLNPKGLIQKVGKEAIQEGLEGVTKSGLRSADNVANGPKLSKQLTNESARSSFNASGGLTEGAIKNSSKIIDSSQIKNTAIPKGFSKYTTETFQSPSGNFQTHFYKNDKTGEVFYGQDYKAIFNSKSGG